MTSPPPFCVDDEEAGGQEPFEDAPLYDFEYRRRRADVNFYRRLAAEQRETQPRSPPCSPILDLACGTGRLTIPLVRDGHTVIGLDRSASMLRRAAGRVQRLAITRKKQVALVRADLRTLAFQTGSCGMAIAAFHSVQHLIAEEDWLHFFAAARRSLRPGGWLAFDVLPPDPDWIARDSNRRWARTTFRHPATGQRLVYTTNHRYDPLRRALHIRLYYQSLDERGDPTGTERIHRLCHRQIAPSEVRRLLALADFRLLATFGGFDGRPLVEDDHGSATENDEHIYVARPR